MLLRIKLGDDLPVCVERREFDALLVRGEALHVDLPGDFGLVELVDQGLAGKQVGGFGGLLFLFVGQEPTGRRRLVSVGDELLGPAFDVGPGLAVVVNPHRLACDQREVIGKARMGDAVILGRVTHAGLGDQLVDERRVLLVAEESVRPVILHHDEDDVLWRGGGGGTMTKKKTGGCGNRKRGGAYGHSGIP